MNFRFLLLCCLVLGSITVFGYTPPRILNAQKVNEPIKIDGNLSEACWLREAEKLPFTLNFPNPGQASSQSNSVWIAYDNTALYVAAVLYDENPEKILKEMTERDRLGNTDWFGVIIDAYQDGQNGLGFFVTPRDLQYDIKYTSNNMQSGGASSIEGGDRTWDAVWETSAKITAQGWIVEMKIPFAALRFPDKEVQVWNINFARQVRRSREISFWNPVDPQVVGMVNQSGKLYGIEKISPPIRLSATPFVVGYLDRYKEPSSNASNIRSISGGMDIKYGINDAFTLDMALIPDFGETRSDNQVLNLSPFEVQFNENRQFFTEGTELFNKANFFYSRRIGGTPLGYSKINMDYDQNRIKSNPNTAQLINATKLSGRTNAGLGIGVFNAITDKVEAIVEVDDGENVQIVTNPLCNYNVIVLDQNLKNNSFINLTNTNVMRSGTEYDANLTGLMYAFRTTDNKFGHSLRSSVSQKYQNGTVDLGHFLSTSIDKLSGLWTYGLIYKEESDTYDPNDLGFLYANNERGAAAYTSFNRYFQEGRFNRIKITANIGYNMLYKPQVYTDSGLFTESFFIMRSFFAFGHFFHWQPNGNRDYFEPRTEDLSVYLPVPSSFEGGGWISTDYRKPVAIDINAEYKQFAESGRSKWAVSIKPRWRVSDQFSLIWEVNRTQLLNDQGWVSNANGITIGQRNQIVIENEATAKWAFNANVSLSVRGRHYWSKVAYQQYLLLSENNTLETLQYDTNHDANFNAFNMDAIFRWRFAPGSDLFVIWKSQLLGRENTSQYSYFTNLEHLGELPHNNSISVKMIYFLDYDTMRNKWR